MLPLLCATSSFPYRGSKLKILDFGHDAVCRTICFQTRTTFSFSFQSCSYSQISALKCEGQHSTVNVVPEAELSSYPTELLVDLSLDGTLRASKFLSLFLSKVEKSSGSLHLCCRDLKIDKLSIKIPWNLWICCGLNTWQLIRFLLVILQPFCLTWSTWTVSVCLKSPLNLWMGKHSKVSLPNLSGWRTLRSSACLSSASQIVYTNCSVESLRGGTWFPWHSLVKKKKGN